MIDSSAFPFVAALASPQPGTQTSIWIQLFPFVLMLGVFYVLVLLPMRRRQKKIQEFQDSIKVGDKVITTSGLYGQVTKITDISAQLQIADKVRIDVAKASIGGYQGQEPVVKDAGGL
ncbi:MAG: preprotein translocase subunit YajC [Vicinamibacterales bacterium]